MDYESTERNLLPTYEHFRAETDLRVLVFNGDTDPGLNSMSTQAAYVEYFSSLGESHTHVFFVARHHHAQAT